MPTSGDRRLMSSLHWRMTRRRAHLPSTISSEGSATKRSTNASLPNGSAVSNLKSRLRSHSTTFASSISPTCSFEVVRSSSGKPSSDWPRNIEAPEHRGQLLNYLVLCDLPKGKLVSVRPELVEHELVNATLRPADRRSFSVDTRDFWPLNDADRTWQQFLVAALRDWGTGLDLHLYEATIAHVFGGEEAVLSDIDIVVGGETRSGSRRRG